MKKRVYGRQLSRDHGSRKALFRSLVRALVLYGSISTTKAKAKAIQGMIDKLVTLAKKGDVTSRRRVYAKLGNNRLITQVLFDKIAPANKGRNSGFTRIINLPRRRGDNAQVVKLEWVEKITPEITIASKKTKGTEKKGKKKDTTTQKTSIKESKPKESDKRVGVSKSFRSAIDTIKRRKSISKKSD